MAPKFRNTVRKLMHGRSYWQGKNSNHQLQLHIPHSFHKPEGFHQPSLWYPLTSRVSENMGVWDISGFWNIKSFPCCLHSCHTVATQVSWCVLLNVVMTSHKELIKLTSFNTKYFNIAFFGSHYPIFQGLHSHTTATGYHTGLGRLWNICITTERSTG